MITQTPGVRTRQVDNRCSTATIRDPSLQKLGRKERWKAYIFIRVDLQTRKKGTTGKTKISADNIKVNLRDIGYGGVDWIDLAQCWDRFIALVNTVMNIQIT
jgi:hypothetical protein